jgi:hypothetical protein
MTKRPRNTFRKSSKIVTVSFITTKIGQTRSQNNLRRIWTISFDKWPSWSGKTDIFAVLGFSCYFRILNKNILIEFERQIIYKANVLKIANLIPVWIQIRGDKTEGKEKVGTKQKL